LYHSCSFLSNNESEPHYSFLAADQFAWVGRVNSIRSRAEEIVFNELVYF